jgi:hypothetical protein
MSERETDKPPADDAVRQPKRVKLPGFISEEIGLGDAVKYVTSSMGIRPCGGCERRAQTLNRWFVFSPGKR